MTDRWNRGIEIAIAVGLAALVLLVRLPSLEQPFDNDSGATAYHARLIVRGEPLYSTHHPAHHLPGVYGAFALAFWLFGDSVWAVKFLLVLWTVVATYLMYLLGKLLANRMTGVLAAAFYAFVSSQVALFGSGAGIELFANLPRIAAVLAMVYLVSSGAAAYKFCLVGVLSAVSFLFKAVYVSPLAIAALVLFVDLYPDRRQTRAWRRAGARGIWIALGFSSVLVLLVGYIATRGLLSRFLLVFSIGRRYVALRGFNPRAFLNLFLLPFAGIGMSNVAAVILACGGVLTALWNGLRHPPGRDRRLPGELYMAAWFLMSFVEAGISGSFFWHYYQVLVPPLAWLAAWFVTGIYRAIGSGVSPSLRWGARVGLIVILAITFGISVWGNREYYVFYARYRLGLGTYEDFVIDGWPQVDTYEFLRVQELADYVRARTSPTDRIYYWSGGVQVYYLADRRCAIDVIWPIYAEATGPYQRIFGEQTKYVIVGDSYLIPRPEWLYPELAKNYVLETVIRGQEVYRRLD